MILYPIGNALGGEINFLLTLADKELFTSSGPSLHNTLKRKRKNSQQAQRQRENGRVPELLKQLV